MVTHDTRAPAGTAGEIPRAVADAGLVERVRGVLRGDVPTVPARDAATVLLLRDGSAGPEVYLLRRVPTMAFAPGMAVFPGGAVDPRDDDPALPWAGPPARSWAAALGGDAPLARALVCAAVRETFEECGVLLAGPTPDAVLGRVDGDAWEADRRAVLAGEPLAHLLDRRDLVLRADLLCPWAHWTTPEAEPRRYDTRFFVAGLPDGQQPRDVGGEADQRLWLRAADAVGAARDGVLRLMPPTLAALDAVAAHDTVAAVLAAQVAVTPVLPRLLPDGAGGLTVLLPGHPRYDDAAPGASGGPT